AISNEVSALSGKFYNYVFSLAGSIPIILFKILLAAVFAFYFIRDGSDLKAHLVGIAPSDHKERFEQLLRGSDIMFQAVVIGYLLKAIFTGIIAVIIFYLFGLPHPILLGITTGALDFIPVIGPWVVELLLFIWFIYQGQYAFAFSLLLATYFFVSFIPEMYIRPRLSGDAAGMHPLIILVGVIGGLFAFGAIGIIIGPMFLGLVVVVVRVYLYKQPYEKIYFGYKDTFLNIFRRRGAREGDKKQGP
ncbi:MAG TPA: AI-2E family transporter, partial [Methanomicrobia archaeon]|nr:AI-2E family transporter [Methanomicrobia archaeon]